MNDKEIQCAITLARTKNMKQAAEELGMHPSSLSRTIKRIEESLDIVLFKRTPEGLILTVAGEAYVKAGRDILNLYHSLKKKESNID